MRAVQEKGIKVYSYMEGYWVQEESKIGTSKGAEWALMRANGEYYDDWSKYNMCQAVPGWQDYITDVSRRVVADTGLDGVYIDCSCRVYHDCYNPDHQHRTPGVFLAGAEELMRLAKEKLHTVDPGAISGSEEPGTDVTSQYLDYGYSYALWYKLGEMPRGTGAAGHEFLPLFLSSIQAD